MQQQQQQQQQQQEPALSFTNSAPDAKRFRWGGWFGAGLALSYGLSGQGSFAGQGMSLGSTYGSRAPIVRFR
jgi:hypothetical protein